MKDFKCDIFLNTDAGSLSAITPVVTMSRDMLSYEPGEIERYGWSKSRLRLYLLRFVQNRSLSRSNGVIFLTKYAAKVIQKSCGNLKNIGLIPHGVGNNFLNTNSSQRDFHKTNKPIKLLYVSNADLYKHQWKVIEAAELLMQMGKDIELTIVGGGSGLAYKKMLDQKNISDPENKFIFLKEFVPSVRTS